jgi:hypothetical protein
MHACERVRMAVGVFEVCVCVCVRVRVSGDVVCFHSSFWIWGFGEYT